MTDAVATVLHGRIGLVLPVRNLPGKDMSLDLFAGKGEEGAEDCHVAPLLAMT